MPRHVPAPSSAARRKAKVAANVRHFYARADYVTPRVALDAATTKALRGHMKREGLGVSDAIRAAIMATAKPRTSAKRQPKARS